MFYDKWQDKKYPSARCRKCHSKYKEENPNTKRNRKSEKLKLRYGLTYDSWKEIRNEQKFQCMICEAHESEIGRHLDVDHCHKNNFVRGVLCNSCNVLLAKAKESEKILKSAIEYLNKYKDGYTKY
jgi:hypothetical protein